MLSSKWHVIKSSLVLFLLLATGAFAQIGSAPYIAINQSEIDSAIWAPVGNGVANDTAKLQAAINYCVTNKRTLLIRRPSVAYKISKLTVGAAATTTGFDMKGVGQARFISDGTAGPMLDLVSLADSRFENLWMDGNGSAGVTGMRVRCVAGQPGQHVSFKQCTFKNCPVYGARLVQDANATCDYFTFEDCSWVTNGSGLRIEGDIRQIDVCGGAFVTHTAYGINIFSGQVNVRDLLFAGNGGGSYYIGSNLAGLNVYRSVHEENPVLTGGGSWNSYSPLVTPILLSGVKQDLYILPFPAGPAIDYNDYKGLILEGCQFVQDVNVGTDSLSVTSINTEFVPFAYSAINAGFTGQTRRVSRFGRGVAENFANLYLGPFQGAVGDLAFDKTLTLDFDGSWDNESWELPIQLPTSGSMTLYDVYAYVVGSNVPTLTFQLEERAAGTINTAGSNIFGAYQTATAAGIHVTVFADSALAAGSHLWWKTGSPAASGTVDSIKLTIKAR